MFLEQRINPSEASSISYFMGCAGQGKSIAVDVHLNDLQWYINQSKQKSVEINYIIDTHIHADHISGARKLAELTGAQYLLHEAASPEFEFKPLKDQQIINAGNVGVKIIHTPGHTIDSICLLVTDNSRVSRPWFLLSQHTLFVGSVGRPDLMGQEKLMAGLLYDSLHERLLTLPEYIEILPGAKAGSVCGAGISAKPFSTIGFEKNNNPTLKLSKQEFIAEVLSTLPPYPKDMKKIVQANTAN